MVYVRSAPDGCTHIFLVLVVQGTLEAHTLSLFPSLVISDSARFIAIEFSYSHSNRKFCFNNFFLFQFGSFYQSSFLFRFGIIYWFIVMLRFCRFQISANVLLYRTIRWSRARLFFLWFAMALNISQKQMFSQLMINLLSNEKSYGSSDSSVHICKDKI